MKTSDALDLVESLGGRYGISPDLTDWDVLEYEGGIALSPEIVGSLCAAAQSFKDDAITAYEMESLHKNFSPLRVRLSRDGIREIRNSLMSHFDLVLLPDSLRWAVVATNELETFVFGPKEFVASLRKQGRKAEPRSDSAA